MIDTPLPDLDLPVPCATGEPSPEPALAHEPELTLEPVRHSAAPAPADEPAAHAGRPISAVMDATLWTVHAEDSIERVEQILADQGLSSAPVVGSNGAVIGMLGAVELAQFHLDGKNAKAVQAWEISRITAFEVSPGDTLEDVARLMSDNKVENISVTEFGRLKGIVSTRDLLQELLKVLPDSSIG